MSYFLAIVGFWWQVFQLLVQLLSKYEWQVSNFGFYVPNGSFFSRLFFPGYSDIYFLELG